MLSKIARPSSMAATMELKLSSVKNHARGFFGDVVAAQSHGDADVGFLERRRVVDAVAGDGDDLAHLFEVETMRSLCSGATRAKIVSPWVKTSRKLIVHLGNFRAGE